MSEKLNLILSLIEKVEFKHKFIKDAKIRIAAIYKGDSRTESIPLESIKEYNFTDAVITECFRLELIQLYTKDAISLERHAYAPELNTLHLKRGGSIQLKQSYPPIETIEAAINFIATKGSLEMLKEYKS